MTWHVEQADALEYLRSLPSSSVDLVLTDPPYYKVKAEWWDRQWDKPEGFLAWIGMLCAEWQRVLRPNGSLYVFASPQMAARVECKVAESFDVLNSLIWDKGDAGRHAGSCKEALRGYFPRTERIVFAEQRGADNMARGESTYAAKCDELRGFVFEPLRAYLDGERERAGVTPREVNEATGSQMAGHWFTRSQWALPTKAHYETMRALFAQRCSEPLRREYEELRREYEELRRPFSVSADVPYTDVWTFPTVQRYPGKHPCEKPQALLRHAIAASTKPGAVVLDSFAGSGSTGVAAVALGRSFIGSEIDDRWCRQARTNIGAATLAERAPVSTKPTPTNDNPRRSSLTRRGDPWPS